MKTASHAFPNPEAPIEISPNLQAQLDVLRAAYAERLDEKIEAICQMWANYSMQNESSASDSDARFGSDAIGTAEPGNAEREDAEFESNENRLEALKTLHRATHTLAGSGATFGFPAVSDTARRAEIALKALLQSGETPQIDSRGEIEAALADLRLSSRAQEETDTFSGPTETVPVRHAARTVFLFSNGNEGLPSWAPSLEAFGYKLEFFVDPLLLSAAWKVAAPAAIVIDCHDEPMACGQGDVLLSGVLSEMPRDLESPVPVLWTCRSSDLRSRLQSVRLGGAAFFSHPVDVDSLLVKLDDVTAHVAPEPFRILIVDDEPSLGRLFSVILRQAGMETLVVSDPMQFMAPLVDFRPDLILMDVYMPGCSGIELAAVIRQQEAYIGIPIMFLSVETDVSRQLAAMREGGDDFLIKPVQPRHLTSAVTTRVTRARALRNLMVRDSLTGLLNHTKTKEQLGVELDRARRLGHTVSLAMLDIDHFKKVNDAYGHATGDRVLRSLSRLLCQRLRQTDVIGRYGGEEFAVIMTGSNAQDAKRKLEIVREAFSGLSHFCDGYEFRVTFSAGIASTPPCIDAVKLSEAADRALYEAKRSGRNCTILAESDTMWADRAPL
ncbi:diguanylate cyclase (GGDEF) domain-containing protein [Abditibacterium utsteinense]|uniref:diguanylate cyclase n=1 Tax=Abditibacterium utsteinense TaxID=1960156 RepID=A0A2S8SW87_9BACT|nr:diguanylate cyclase [Abditibacterium utsteinense]PQV65060.1 diguanylate cyclase (GGDEF) domain-containing protein [Abditibacterium utsteinense]